MPCKHRAEGRYAFDATGYWQTRYSEFEQRMLRNEKFWRAPAHQLQGTELFGVFQSLFAKFPDHPDDHNTVFYLVEEIGRTPKTYSVLLHCDHFEHTSIDDIRGLAEFLADASVTITTNRLAGIDVLDAYREELQLRFYSPREEIIAILYSCSSKMAEPSAPPNGGPAASVCNSEGIKGPPSRS